MNFQSRPDLFLNHTQFKTIFCRSLSILLDGESSFQMTFSSTTLPKRAARLLFCAVFVQSLGAKPKCKNNKYWYDNFATNQMAYSQVIFGAAILLLLVSNVFSRVCTSILSTNVKFWNWFHGNNKIAQKWNFSQAMHLNLCAKTSFSCYADLILIRWIQLCWTLWSTTPQQVGAL